jgi:hypothetical protein
MCWVGVEFREFWELRAEGMAEDPVLGLMGMGAEITAGVTGGWGRSPAESMVVRKKERREELFWGQFQGN